MLARIFPRSHGTVYDAIVFLGGFVLPYLAALAGASMPSLDFFGEENKDSFWIFGVLQTTAVLVQIPGAWLKRAALHTRIHADEASMQRAAAGQNLLYFLLILHWTFGFAMLAMALTAVPGMTAEWALPIALGTSTLTTWIVGATAITGEGRSGSTEATPEQRRGLVRREAIGDAFLIAGALILVHIWWVPLINEVAAGDGHIQREAGNSLGGLIAYTLVMFVPFLMFYILPRLLFFVEDARHPGTWIRFLILYVFAAWQMFTGSAL